MLNIIPFMFPQFPLQTDLSDIKAKTHWKIRGEICSIINLIQVGCLKWEDFVTICSPVVTSA